MLFTVQLSHTLIALLNFACLFYMTWAHWTRRGGGRLLRFAYWVIALEAVAIIPFGLSCPIAHFVDRVWGTDVPDILLPKRFSRWLIEAGVWLFAFAMVPPLVRWRRRRNSARAGAEAGEGVAASGEVGLPVAAPDEA